MASQDEAVGPLAGASRIGVIWRSLTPSNHGTVASDRSWEEFNNVTAESHIAKACCQVKLQIWNSTQTRIHYPTPYNNSLELYTKYPS